MSSGIRITQALLGEHAVFYRLFQAFEARDGAAEGNALAAMLEVALAAHARLEEELLFAELASRIGPAGPLQVMHMEHDAIDRTLARLPAAADAAETWQLIREVMDIARVHFAKEEEILFPLADRTIPAEILQQLGRRWAELSGVRLP